MIPTSPSRRRALAGFALVAAAAPMLVQAAGPAAKAAAADPYEGDPFQSLPWGDMRREYLGGERAVFDERVTVRGPAFAEDPMNVPISVAVRDLTDIERIVILVDRNPIRRVLEYQPMSALPVVSFRFKLEQASPVRAAVRTRDGLWHVGGAWVDSAGGGCTVSGATRKDGSWTQTLGLVSGKVFESAAGTSSTPAPAATPVPGAARLRLRVMHPMDTGLVGGIPAFYVNRLSVRDGADRELLRLSTYEPVSENPVFSFDFPQRPEGTLRIVGTDNNGNRIDARLD
ncbi:MAG TPA: quinoprotein dehydrogenase-associated SoxYZ-like carrier [Burkholderiaceae bacterium]|nr:quinoprotein dehydrogenase-associated SoxYZ-like carrier [Burkholderiaceae bacterium]HMX10597.1 quinoprotein dehydrogenase-associated SoxYZ-like carrier [Burkholderiaceae bacterium]HMY99578.1 quinoprotein dehydrogenase-associated SoxYZ-like carrier [Burkholderiaceae bacterium]HNB44738.1 quinoprotein dehydrogenase-associated SoxYZ-like carrier [Burkholderiaceae bacterium]